VSFTVDPETVALLREQARSAGATLFMALHTAVAAMLHDSGAGHDIAIGTVVAGRTTDTLEDLVGFFVNTVVLRTAVPACRPLRDLLAAVRDADLAAFEHQDVPFDVLVDALRPPPAPGRNPLFQVALVYEEEDGAGLDLPGVRAERLALDHDVAKFDLTVLATVRADTTLSVVLAYAVDLFDRPTAQVVAGRLEQVLHTLATDPAAPLRCDGSACVTGVEPAGHTVRP
jgi:non-ribosomal peptide synthetase component F